MDNKFLKIIQDKTSGSAELRIRLMMYLQERVKRGYSITKEVRNAEKMLGHFATIKNELIRLKKVMKDNDNEKLYHYLSSINTNENKIYYKLFTSIPDSIKECNKIITLSNSQTVFGVLKYWKQLNTKLTVYTLESHPGGEGRIMHNKLKEAGIRSIMIKDALLSKYLEKSDLLLIGCDAILKHGDVINKAGSRNAAVIAKYLKKPVIVVSSKSKKTCNRHYKIKGRTPDEKYNFEKVEKELITHLITD